MAGFLSGIGGFGEGLRESFVPFATQAIGQKWQATEAQKEIERKLMLSGAEAGVTGSPEQATKLFGEGGAGMLGQIGEAQQEKMAKEDRRLKRQEAGATIDRMLKAVNSLDELSPTAQLAMIDTFNNSLANTGTDFRLTDVNNAKDAKDQIANFSKDSYLKKLGTALKTPNIENLRDFNDTVSIVAKYPKMFPEFDFKEDRKRIVDAISEDMKEKKKAPTGLELYQKDPEAYKKFKEAGRAPTEKGWQRKTKTYIDNGKLYKQDYDYNPKTREEKSAGKPYLSRDLGSALEQWLLGNDPKKIF